MESFFVGPVPIAHDQPERRTIREINFPDSSAQCFEVHRLLPLGNHFHKEKTETFYVTEGAGVVYFQDTNNPDAEVVKFEVIKGDVVWVTPGVAHTFLLQPGSKMICFSSAPFDSKNMDMYPHVLVEPQG